MGAAAADDAVRATTLSWPENVPSDQERTRRAREELLTSGLIAAPVGGTGVRPVIEQSWRRCVGGAVPVRPDSIPYRDPADLQPRLRDAAAPVLERLGDILNGARVAMFLSDRCGRIVMRKAGDPAHQRVLDATCAAEGFDFSEASIGTNGLGTVLAERRSILVHGSEHYNDDLQPLTCAGTPVFEPFTGQIAGTFALSCLSAEANPLMCAMATDVGRQIESNLAAMLGAHERALIQSYLIANRPDRDPVVVITERSTFANTAGLHHVSAEAHALLWTHLSEANLPRGRRRMRVPLPTGWHAADVEHVDDREPTRSAYCIRLIDTAADPAAPRRRPSTARTGHCLVPPSPTQRLHPLPDVDEQLRTAVNLGEVLAVDGPAGTGKLHVATAALAHVTAAEPIVVDLALDDVRRNATAAEQALRESRGVVLRHLQDLPQEDVNRIKAVLDGASGRTESVPGPPIALTVDLTAAAEHVHAVVAGLCTPVRLPALREMPEQIPQLVTDILRGLPEPLPATRFSSDALQLLMRWSWPGNLAELRRTVEISARRMPGRTVGSLDLPPRMQQARSRGLSLIESAERDAIITALRRAGGNRTKAAHALGIGRTTLYRKLQAHRIPI